MNFKAIAVLAMTCLITACGGGGGGSGNSGGTGSTNPPPAAASPGGIWTGTDSGTGLALTAMVSESGQAQVIRADRTQYFGNITVSGTSISGNLDGIAPFGSTFPDGSRHGTGKVTGTLAQQSSIQATVTFTTDSGETTTSNATLTFQSLYNTQPNVANFAGTYTEANTGATVSINSGGAIFVQDPNTGCVVNGQINVVQGNFSLYAALVDYASCVGPSSPLNGLQFAGFVELNGNSALAGLQDKSGKRYGLVYSLTKQ
jgi:hypothetical protein